MGTFLKKFTTTALVGIVGSAVFYTPAHAVSSAYVRAQHNKTRSHVSKENEKVREQVKTSIELQTELLIEALKGQARENSNYQQMQVEGAQRIEDAAQINHTNRLKDEFRAKAQTNNSDPDTQCYLPRSVLFFFSDQCRRKRAPTDMSVGAQIVALILPTSTSRSYTAHPTLCVGRLQCRPVLVVMCGHGR